MRISKPLLHQANVCWSLYPCPACRVGCAWVTATHGPRSLWRTVVLEGIPRRLVHTCCRCGAAFLEDQGDITIRIYRGKL